MTGLGAASQASQGLITALLALASEVNKGSLTQSEPTSATKAQNLGPDWHCRPITRWLHPQGRRAVPGSTYTREGAQPYHSPPRQSVQFQSEQNREHCSLAAGQRAPSRAWAFENEDLKEGLGPPRTREVSETCTGREATGVGKKLKASIDGPDQERQKFLL